MKKLFLFLSLLIINYGVLFAQEQITITTYYPSPHGSYDELGANKFAVDINNVAVASEYAAMANGDAHIGRSLIVGGGGTGFAFDELIGPPDIRPADGTLLVKSNAGIGVTAPLSTLDVRGVIRNSAAVGNTTRTVFAVNAVDEGAPGADGFRMRFDNDFFGANQDALVLQKTDGDDADPDGGIAFVNNGTGGTDTAMVIRGTGNVGINVLAPTGLLHLFRTYTDPIYGGNFKIFDDSPGGDAGGAEVAFDGRTDGIFTFANYGVSTGSTRFGYWDGAVMNQRLTINNTGQVGIGTTAPESTAKLHIVATDEDGLILDTPNTRLRIYEDVNDANYIKFRPVTGTGFIFSDNGDTEWMVIEEATGDIGIGLKDPTSRLHIRSASPVAGEMGFAKVGGNLWFDGGNDQTATIQMTTAGGTINFVDKDSNIQVTIEEASGNVGIGVSDPTVRLDISGAIERTGACTLVSDIALKENFKEISNPLNKIISLHGIYYNLKSDKDKKRQIGLIAQEVEKVLPEIVSVTNEKGHKGVVYEGIIPVLIESTKELKKENESLKDRIAKLEQKVDQINKK